MLPIRQKLSKLSRRQQIGLIFILMILMISIGVGMTTNDGKNAHATEADKNAYQITFKDKVIGIVKDQEEAQKAFEAAQKKIEKSLNAEIQVDTQLKIDPVHASEEELVDTTYMTDALYNMFKQGQDLYLVKAYTITVNDETEVILDKEETANNLLNEIKNSYILEEFKDQVEVVEFIEDVSVVPSFVEPSQVMTKEEGMDILTATTEEKQVYEVEKGDCLSIIAEKKDTTVEELLKLNSDITIDDFLQIGQELTITVPTPLVSIQTKERIVYTEAIPKLVEYKKDSSKYKDYSEVIEEGKDGSKEITAYEIRLNGYVEGREIISEKVIEEPQTSVILVGTNPLPPKRATGTFIRPTNGRLTSSYGPRWGEFHAGIDLASPIGTPIKAADGGKVIYADWSGSYGKLVKIDHGNGFVTYYAHTSKIYVQVGQKVAKGEVIAAVGSTGNSTGPHVHFEIRKDGYAYNPFNYVK